MSVRPDLPRAVVAVLAGFSLTVAVAGCSSSTDHQPVRLGARPVAIAPSVRPTVATQPVLSPKAAEIAVVRKYFAMVNRLRTNMDPTALAALMTADCPCRKLVRSVRDEAARHRVYFGSTSINKIRLNIDGANIGDVLVDFDTTTSGLRTASGVDLTDTPPRQHVNLDFTIVRTSNRWLISKVDQL